MIAMTVDPSWLQILWFALIAVLWIGFLVLEGFDFGVGMLIKNMPALAAGIIAIGAMSVAMWLVLRPKWLEPHLDGLDKIYRLHKWSGILAVTFGALHWLIKQSGGLIKGLIGSEGRLPKIKYDGVLEAMRELGKQVAHLTHGGDVILLSGPDRKSVV